MEIAVDLPKVGYGRIWQSQRDKPLTAYAVDVMLKDGSVVDGRWVERGIDYKSAVLNDKQCRGWVVDGAVIDWELVHGWKYKKSRSNNPFNRNYKVI